MLMERFALFVIFVGCLGGSPVALVFASVAIMYFLLLATLAGRIELVFLAMVYVTFLATGFANAPGDEATIQSLFTMMYAILALDYFRAREIARNLRRNKGRR